MARPIQPADSRELTLVDVALAHLISARDLLAEAESPQALARVRLAISSARGARRHMERRVNTTARELRAANEERRP
jgi:hypothetical protein